MKEKNSKTRITYLSLLLLMLIISSCSDEFFDPQYGNRISPDDHYQSQMDLSNSLDGILSCLRDVVPNTIILDGIRSDMMDITENASVDMSNLYYQKYDKANPLLDVSGFYKAIINTNEVLANIDSVTAKDPSFDAYLNKTVRGYLISMRAWTYFQLVRLNGEAAYISNNLTEIPADLSQQYIPKDAMIDTLINQLLPYVHTDQTKVEYVVGWYPNIKAMLGELYLEKNDYVNAATYLKMAMEISGNSPQLYKVTQGYSRESWETIFTQGASASSENISALSYNATEGQPNPLSVWMQPANQYVVKPSSIIYSKFINQKLKNGIVGDIYRGIGVSIDTLGSSTERYIKKYSLFEGIDGYSLDIPIMRCADIHLLLAEAFNRSGQSNIALILLNQGMNNEKKRPSEFIKWSNNLGVRGRVNLESRVIPAEITDPNMIVEMIEDYIIEERSMELAFEGYRMFDLIRIAKRRGNPDYLASRVAAKYPTGIQDQVKGFFMNEANWYIPINK
jgi:tetratricopeptide (TPR) repeat protein